MPGNGDAAAAIETGGHVAVGLGDYPYTELGAPTNADVVREVARLARAMGREMATPDDTRETLGMARGRGAGAPRSFAWPGRLRPIPHRLFVARHPQKDPAGGPQTNSPQATRS